MTKCFVIQPFSEKFQKRYADVYREAIVGAELEPYKVDEDQSASILIEAIERNIRSADVCFAEISERNVNVWFELGFAISAGKGICMVCAKQSLDRLPFDVQHRSVIFYDEDSVSDFIALKEKITVRLVALKKSVSLVPVVTQLDDHIPGIGLKEYELVTLAVVASEQNGLDGSVSISGLRDAVGRAGYTDIAAALGYRGLIVKGLVEEFEDADYSGDPYRACRVTAAGWDRLLENEERLELKKGKRPKKIPDEIPF